MYYQNESVITRPRVHVMIANKPTCNRSVPLSVSKRKRRVNQKFNLQINISRPYICSCSRESSLRGRKNIVRFHIITVINVKNTWIFVTNIYSSSASVEKNSLPFFFTCLLLQQLLRIIKRGIKLQLASLYYAPCTFSSWFDIYFVARINRQFVSHLD